MQEEKSGSIIARTTLAFTCGPISVGKLATALLTLLIYHSTISAKADHCPTTKDEISTDRPDVTNSSVVVPAGSLQFENGINSSGRDGSRFVDGTNTRLRWTIKPGKDLFIVWNRGWQRLILSPNETSIVPQSDVLAIKLRWTFRR